VTASTHAQPDEEHPARVSLVSAFDAVRAGETSLIGIRFEMDPKWHIYWDGQNETGLSPTVEWTLPEGVTAGPIHWPTPKRYISAGDILDHVYEDVVTLLVPLTVDDSVEPGGAVTIESSLEWLVCADVCIPGWGESTLTLRVDGPGSERSPGAGHADITAARASLPMKAPDSQVDFSWSWSGETLVITPRRPFERAAFMPGPGSLHVENLLESGVSDEGPLRLRVDTTLGPVGGRERAGPRAEIRGVLEIVRGATSPPTRYEVAFPLPASEARRVDRSRD